MRTAHLTNLTLVLAAALTVTSCNPFRSTPVNQVTTDVNRNSRWRASLVSPAALAGAVQMNGSATMQPGTSAGSTDFSLNIANATPGGVHPWQVHRGRCGADAGVVGSAEEYGTIRIGDNGQGTTTASVKMETPTSGDYFVTVQASPANLGTVVACGNLAPPAM